MQEIYKKAFEEVYEVLSYLDDEEYKKIPKDVVEAIEENRDEKYVFFLDEELSLSEQDLLEESKAILFNLYRDYLANSEIRRKIYEYQREEINEIERIKKEKHINKIKRK